MRTSGEGRGWGFGVGKRWKMYVSRTISVS